MPTTQSACQTPWYLQIATFLEIALHHIWGTFAKKNQDLEVLRAEKISGSSTLTPQGFNLQLFHDKLGRSKFYAFTDDIDEKMVPILDFFDQGKNYNI